MNKYEVMTNGEKIEIEAEYYTTIEDNILNFYYYNIGDEMDELATFKEWSYVRKV